MNVLLGQLRKEPFHQIQPRRAGRYEVEENVLAAGPTISSPRDADGSSSCPE